MSEMELVEAVKSGNMEAVRELLESGAEVGRQNKQGWTALNWAAAKGSVELIELLLRHGADPTAVGRDLRTPSMIALAAGQAEAAKVLRRAEAEKGGDGAQPERKYCASYYLSELRRYPGWSESAVGGDGAGEQGQALSDGDVVFIHQDYRVTKSVWSDEDVIFSEVNGQWKDFCHNELGFAVPDDLDLIGEPVEASPAAA